MKKRDNSSSGKLKFGREDSSNRGFSKFKKQIRHNRKVDDSSMSSYFISCPRGLEENLETELVNLDLNKFVKHSGGIEIRCKIMDIFKVIINSRIASRVFLHLDTFKIFTEKDIYKKSVGFAWDNVFNNKQTFKINTILDRKAGTLIKSSLLLSQILKDAIVDSFRNSTGERPSVSTKEPDISFLLRVEENEEAESLTCKILLDLVGEPLSNRGYRTGKHIAPLRENLAAGIIQNLEWNEESEILIDSMCGTGTLLIEALLIKEKIPPSYLKIKEHLEQKARPWAFLSQTWFTSDKSLFGQFKDMVRDIYGENKKTLENIKPGSFYGIDNSKKSIEITKLNLENALIPESAITLNVEDATKLKNSFNDKGIIICNPPYGERMGANDDLKNLYYQYGENLKNNFKDYRAYILTSDPELRKSISLTTSKRVKLYNGPLECRLLEYKLY